MNEWEKAQNGYLYNASDESLMEGRFRCADLCYELNHCRPSDFEKQQKLLHEIIGVIKGDIYVAPPFYCDFGTNITIGKHFQANHNVIILDPAPVTFGDNVYVAPNCVFSTAGHPIDAEQRNKDLEIALPITVGDNVWFGTQVSVMPGVTIGSNVVIGAGSVVTRDIPSGVIAVGNPCRVLREITEKDKEKYKFYEE